MTSRDPRYNQQPPPQNQSRIAPPPGARQAPPPPQVRELGGRTRIPDGLPSPLFKQPVSPQPSSSPLGSPVQVEVQPNVPPLRQSGEQERQIVQQQIDTPKPSKRAGEFPGGWIDQNLILHQSVEVREIRGHEEELIANDSIDTYTKIDLILSACLQRVGTITDRGLISALVPDLLVGDRVWLLMEIRRASVGDKYPFIEKCPECEEEQSFTLDMNTLPVVRLKDPMKRIFPVTTESGLVAELIMPTGRQERMRDSIKLNDENALSKILLTRIATLNGKVPTLDDVLNLSLSDRTELKLEYDDLPECGMDLTIETTCPNTRSLEREYNEEGHIVKKTYVNRPCGFERSRQMSIGDPGFFYPAQVLRRWKKKLLSLQKPSDIPTTTV